MRALKIGRSTVFYILQKLRDEGVLFEEVSPISGMKIVKLADTPKSRALLCGAISLCISEHVKGGANADEIFS